MRYFFIFTALLSKSIKFGMKIGVAILYKFRVGPISNFKMAAKNSRWPPKFWNNCKYVIKILTFLYTSKKKSKRTPYLTHNM